MENFKITKITLKPSKDMDVKYINEFLEKRISHGMDYFGKDKKFKNLKIKKLFFIFLFFGEKNLCSKQTLGNTGKCFPEIF